MEDIVEALEAVSVFIVIIYILRNEVEVIDSLWECWTDINSEVCSSISNQESFQVNKYFIRVCFRKNVMLVNLP
jgi:hypothetical protein